MQSGAFGAPDSYPPSCRRSPAIPMVVMMPVVVPPVAEVADAARTVVGPDDATAAVRVVIGVVVVIRIVGCSVEESPVKVMPVMGEPNAPVVEDRASANRAAVEYGAAGSNSAGMKHRAPCAGPAAMECRATAAEPATAMPTAAAVATTSATSASAAVSTTHFDGRRAGDCLRDRRCAGIDQRHGLT
jgi:hypothetical protein